MSVMPSRSWVAGLDFPDIHTLIHAVDGVAETRGMGIVLISDGLVHRLRPSALDGSDVVFEYRESPLPQVPGPKPVPRDETTSPVMEWVGLGFNCGGAVLSWIGVIGTGALTPVTGGLSGFATAALWGGALAATAQCATSEYRLINLQRGRADINAALDRNPNYVRVMQGLDGFGLIAASGVFIEIKTTAKAIEGAGLGWKAAATGAISRPQRLAITEAMELKGAKRVPAAQINAVVRQKLLDLLVASIGVTGSSVNGVLKDLVVWVVSADQSQ